jgi:hypothetical protein
LRRRGRASDTRAAEYGNKQATPDIEAYQVVVPSFINPTLKEGNAASKFAKFRPAQPI